jgi:hypothetical protein
MTQPSIPLLRRIDWRVLIFRIVAGPLALIFLAIGGTSLLWPWNIIPFPDVQNPELWRWHAGVWGAVSAISVAGALLVLVVRPRQNPLLMQSLLLGGILGTAAWLVATWPAVEYDEIVIYTLLLAAYPAHRALLSLRGEAPLSKPMVRLGIAALLGLAPVFWQNVHLQLTDVSSEFHSVGAYMHLIGIAVTIPLSAFLAATRRPGWQATVTIAGLTLLYLGAAALSVPNHPGSWGAAGGLLSLLGGLAFIVIPFWENRRPAAAAPVVSARTALS